MTRQEVDKCYGSVIDRIDNLAMMARLITPIKDEADAQWRANNRQQWQALVKFVIEQHALVISVLTAAGVDCGCGPNKKGGE